MAIHRDKAPASVAQGMTRRDFFQAAAVSAGATAWAGADTGWLHASSCANANNCILLFLVGGPSQLDTWDMKPGAPEQIRGPFRPTQTNVPGIQICEHFPRMAQ